jgi:RNA polymerase sigma-70 factor (ECF subfamily)
MNTPTAHNLKDYSDEDVMQLFQSGYEEAYTEIIQRYRERIHKFIFSFTKDVMDSEDMTQETFFRVYKSKHLYERIAKFSTRLFTIATNLVRSHYRKHSKRYNTPLEGINKNDEPFEILLVDEVISSEERIEQKQFMEIVESSLKEIPLEFRELVELRDLKDLSYEEIMEITGLPMGTVKSRINRGRARLYSKVKKVYNSETK